MEAMKKLLLTTICVFGLVEILSGCKKELLINPTEVVLYNGSQEKIQVDGEENGITYVSENPLIATVSNDGVVTGWVRGETNILVSAGSKKAICKAQVKTRVNSIPEIDASTLGMAETEAKEKLTQNGESITTTEDGFGYVKTVSGTKIAYIYLHENGKIQTCLMTLSLSSSLAPTIVDFATERYSVVTKTGTYSLAMVSPTKEYAVLLSAENGRITLLYTLYNQKNNLKSATIEAYLHEEEH